MKSREKIACAVLEVIFLPPKCFCPRHLPFLRLGQGLGSPDNTFTDLISLRVTWRAFAVTYFGDGFCLLARAAESVRSPGTLQMESRFWTIHREEVTTKNVTLGLFNLPQLDSRAALALSQWVTNLRTKW